MQQTLEVNTADFAVASEPMVLESSGIGSCVVVCFYDQTQKRGALCHIMLPKQPDAGALNPLRFADTALPMVLEKLEAMGSPRANLIAHIVGGAHMFKTLGAFVNHIGGQNVAAVQQTLAQQGIPIESMNVGGDKGRSVSFALDSGIVNITSRT